MLIPWRVWTSSNINNINNSSNNNNTVPLCTFPDVKWNISQQPQSEMHQQKNNFEEENTLKPSKSRPWFGDTLVGFHSEMTSMVFTGEETSFELARCLDTYGVLEEFGVQLTADDFYQRWGHPMVVSYAGEKKAELSDLIKLPFQVAANHNVPS